MDANGVVSVISSGDNTLSYVVAPSAQGRVVLAGPFATPAEALKATQTHF
jgi:hypothetical protein